MKTTRPVAEQIEIDSEIDPARSIRSRFFDTYRRRSPDVASHSSRFRFSHALAIGAWLAGASGCAATPARDAAAVDPVEEVARWMAGHYDSRDQAAADSTYYPIALSMVPIWPERRDGHWLYVEQAMAETPEKPYRQRVYRVSAGTDGEVLSAVFTIEQPARFVQGWRNGALAGLTEAMLQPREGCTVALRRGQDGWRGATRGTACASDLRGAAYATAEVALDATQMRSWDRGYAAEGRQVWGANAGPYVFVKREPAR